jgi:hypothetical protein
VNPARASVKTTPNHAVRGSDATRRLTRVQSSIILKGTGRRRKGVLLIFQSARREERTALLAGHPRRDYRPVQGAVRAALKADRLLAEIKENGPEAKVSAIRRASIETDAAGRARGAGIEGKVAGRAFFDRGGFARPRRPECDPPVAGSIIRIFRTAESPNLRHYSEG